MLRRTRFLFSVLCLCSAFSLSADDALTFVVTASRESVDIMDAPAQMTVITSEDIQSSGKTGLVQILEDVAGVSFRSITGEAEAQVSMRGFGENSHGRVQVFIDGRRLNNPDMASLNWLSVPISSIERIEVLDGPSSVLYGSGAVGGVINIITKESAAGVTAGATLSYGSFNTRRVQVNGGFGTDSVGFLVSADHYSTDGFRDRTESKNTNVTVNAFADITDKLTLKPSFTFADIYYQLPGYLTKVQFQTDPTQAKYYKDDSTERDLGAALLTQLAVSDNFSIELPLSYMKKDRKAEMVSNYSLVYMTPESHTDRIQHQFEAKPKLSINLEAGSASLQFIGGFDLAGAKYNVEDYAEEERITLTSDYDFSQLTYAPFIVSKISFPFNLDAVLGVRYESYNLKTSDEVAKKEYEKKSVAFAYDVAMNFHPSENGSVYLKYNTLFRYPFIDEILTYGVFLQDLEPEIGYNLEAGTKYKLNSMLSTSFNIYYMMMKDEISYNLATYQNENLDTTKRIGGNLALSLTPIRLIEVNGSLGYVKATFADGINENKMIPLVPELTANSGVTFNIPMGIKIGADVSYTGESYRGGDTANMNDVVEAYTLYGLTASFTPPALGGKLSVNGRVDNLLDVSYVPFVFYSGYYPAAGRAITVSASYRY